MFNAFGVVCYHRFCFLMIHLIRLLITNFLQNDSEEAWRFPGEGPAWGGTRPKDFKKALNRRGGVEEIPHLTNTQFFFF